MGDLLKLQVRNGKTKAQLDPGSALLSRKRNRATVGNGMDSWMPWRITCNFIRAFFPTLGLLICWDTWRNLSHGPPRNQVAITADVVALGVVFAIRLALPLTLAREQVKHLFRWSAGLAMMLAMVLSTIHNSKVDHKDVLLLIAGYAVCCDLARTCKISPDDAERKINFVYTTMAFLAVFVSAMASSFRQTWEGTLPPRDAWLSAILIHTLLIIFAVKWWGGGYESIPHIQTLNLNERKSPADGEPKSA
jgi:hypothetical protein